MKETSEKRNSRAGAEPGLASVKRRVSPLAVLFTAAVFAALVGAIYHSWKGRSLFHPRYDLMAKRLPEPSGIVFHPIRKTLFVVGDEGAIVEMTTKGEILHGSSAPKTDFEGITVNADTGLLYAVVEKENRIFEIDPGSLKVRRRFSIDGRYMGSLLLAPGRGGLEGIAWVPQGNRPGGGMFFIVNRGPSAGRSRPRAGHSFVARLSVSLDASPGREGEAKIEQAVACRVADLSDLTFLADGRTLVAISDRENVLIEMDLTATILRKRRIPGRAQEGIALEPARGGRIVMYIAQDCGGVLKTDFHHPENVLSRKKW